MPTNPPFFIPAVIIGLLSLPLIFKQIPRQGWYGIRTAKTLSNDEFWYLANAKGGKLLLTSSIIYLVVAWKIPYTSSETDFRIWLIHFGAFILPLLVSLILIQNYIKKL